MTPVDGGGLDRLFAYTSDAVFVDQGGVVVAVNANGADLYGCSLDELVGRPTIELVPDEMRAFILDRAARVDAGRERDRWADEEILRADGTTSPVVVRSTPIVWEDAPAVLVVMRDTSERRRIEAELEYRDTMTAVVTDVSLALARAGEDELDRIVEDTLRTIAVHNDVDRSYLIRFSDDGDLINCTHEWCAPGVEPQIEYVQDLSTKDFEWSYGLLVRHEPVHVSDLDALPPEAAPERASFAQFGVQSILQVPMIVGGNVIGLIGFNSIARSVAWPEATITLVRGVADALATALVRREATRAVRVARDEAEQANSAKDQFLSRMSHELRTPLNAVLGFTELLLLDERPESDRTSLERVRSSGEHLLSLVEDVLDISRISAGRLSISMEPVEVAPVVEAAVAMTRSAALAPDLTMRVDVPSGVVVHADRQRLQQVLVNLLSNAIKYNRPDGSVEVLAHVVGPRRLRLEVVDSGIGIPPERMDGIFEPFDRLGREGSAVEGVGIGLTLTKLLVEMMSGTIDVDSVEGEGSTFAVELNLAEPVAASPARTSTVVGGRTVLCVEDNESSMFLLRQVIEREDGLEMLEATNVADGVALAAAHLPALILLDLHLVGGTGEELLAALRTSAETKHIPVVIVTADATREVMARVLAAGAVDFLPKPIDVGRLQEIIRRYTD